MTTAPNTYEVEARERKAARLIAHLRATLTAAQGEAVSAAEVAAVARRMTATQWVDLADRAAGFLGRLR
jgi:hypothetical protein